ncbi:MAG TPA: biotin/lipoyl-containing protein [Acidimicrobiia bacterium]|nr:biotin/lipoyl-containing protein [Acidimicrobiia bacterium]
MEWQVGVGDRIESEQVLVTVDTDKVDTDVPSPVAGVVEILAEAGAQLTVRDPTCVLEA